MAELLGEIGVGGLVDRLGKRRSVAIGLGFTAAGYVALALNSVDLWAALIWLFALFICFEFMIVATIPLVTELVPAARGTMLALNLASSSLGRATGALIALPSGWWVGCSGPDWRPERSHSARQACCYDTSTIPSAAGRMTVP
jgi:MFS family permease